MNGHVRISLPNEISSELIDAKLAVKPIITRGPTWGEAFLLTVDCINTGSAVVSIAVAIGACRRIAATIIRRRHPADPDLLTIKLSRGGSTKSLTVDRTAPAAQDEVLDFLLAAFNG